MDRMLDIKRTIVNDYKNKLWDPFLKALSDYNLFKENDIINVIIDGTNSSFLLAKLLEIYKNEFKFDLHILAYNLEEIKSNLEILNIKAEFISFEYELDDNLIYAFHDNFDDVIENTLTSILFKGKYETIIPKENNIIRPLYLIKYKDIKAWERKNELTFIKKHIPKEQMKIKEIIRELLEYNDSVENNILSSIESVNKLLGLIKDKKESL